MALHMRELEGCPRPLLVSILEQPLPILELFEVLNDKLAGKERAEMYNSPNERPQREVKVQIPPETNGDKGVLTEYPPPTIPQRQPPRVMYPLIIHPVHRALQVVVEGVTQVEIPRSCLSI